MPGPARRALTSSAEQPPAESGCRSYASHATPPPKTCIKSGTLLSKRMHRRPLAPQPMGVTTPREDLTTAEDIAAINAEHAIRAIRSGPPPAPQVCIIHTMNSKDLIKELTKDGWIIDRVAGSHHVMKHPTKPGHVTVPHPKKDLGKGLVQAILKQAGLK